MWSVPLPFRFHSFGISNDGGYGLLFDRRDVHSRGERDEQARSQPGIRAYDRRWFRSGWVRRRVPVHKFQWGKDVSQSDVKHAGSPAFAESFGIRGLGVGGYIFLRRT